MIIDLDETFTPVGGGPTGLCVECRMLAFRHTQHGRPACDEWPECAAGRTTDHYHVLAVQDWGGSQEYWCGHDDRLSLAAARKLADDMGRADTMGLEEAEREFGDRLSDLISTNVAPGWEGIWTIPCADACHYAEILGHTLDAEWGEPYWTPARGPMTDRGGRRDVG